jgi:hypothetical protein
MKDMFNGAVLFNQYIRSWNVEHLSEPENFSTSSNLSPSNTPNWGGETTMLPDEEHDDTARSIRLKVPSTRVVKANLQKQPSKKQFTIVPDYTNIVPDYTNIVPDYTNIVPDYTNIVAEYTNADVNESAKDI